MYTAIALVVLVLAVLLIYAATRPDDFRVRRAARIDAGADRIFPLLEDFHSWAVWSPWEKMDPAMRRTHSGPSRGVGAVYEWEGNGKVGKGRMEILQASPARVEVKLDFIKPFEGHNIAEFTLAPQGNATDVTWEMRGPRPYIAKLMSVFLDMDRMIGKDFEAGLASLKAAAEK